MGDPARCWAYVHRDGRVPEGITKAELARQCNEQFAQMFKSTRGEHGSKQWNQHEAHKRAVVKAGGYLEFSALLLWRSLRLGESSVMVAEQMGVNPCCVRQKVALANGMARRLGLEVYNRDHWSRCCYRKIHVRKDTRARRKRAQKLFWLEQTSAATI